MISQRLWLLLLMLLFLPSILVLTNAADFDLSITPTYVKVRAGESAYFHISLNVLTPGFSNDVYLTAFFEPPSTSITFSDNPLNPTGDTDSVMTVRTSVYTPPGVYTITIRGRDPSTSQSVYVDVTLEVLPPSPEFTLSISPSHKTVFKGEKALFTVQASPHNGFSSPIYLRLLCPSCVSYTFNPNPMCPGAVSCSCPAIPCYTYTSQLSIDTAGMSPGNYSIVVEGCNDGACSRAYASLTVKEAPKPEEINLIVYPITVKSKPGGTFYFRVTVGIPGGKSPEPLTLKVSGPLGWYISRYPTKLEETKYLDFWVTIPKNAILGTYGISVDLYREDTLIKSRSILVYVEKPATNLSLAVAPREVILSEDNPKAEVAIYLNSTSSVEASLSVIGIPSGISYSITPKLKPGELGLLNMSLKGAEPGDYRVTISASGGGTLATSSLLVKVRTPTATSSIATTKKPEVVTITKTVSALQTVTITQVPSSQAIASPVVLGGIFILLVAILVVTILSLLRRGGHGGVAAAPVEAG